MEKTTNAVNYDEEMRKTLSALKEAEAGGGTRAKLLLHSCCAPCSSACLEILKDFVSVTVFYYNPNIDEAEEYAKRKAEQIRFLRETGWAEFIDCDYDCAAFEAIAKGREACSEGGARCYECYKLRLFKTAERAAADGFDYFASTLSVSPYKNAAWLNEIGFAAGEKYGVKFLPSDFKKKGGYLRSTELSKEYGLYRQNYCGCKFSKREAEEREARARKNGNAAGKATDEATATRKMRSGGTENAENE